MKKCISLSIAVIMICMVLPFNVLAESDVVIIKNASELYNIRNNLAGNYRLEEDIDLTEYDSWLPIGKQSAGNNIPDAFTGTLDGNGHIVTGLTILDDDGFYCGLIGVNNGTIKNLTVKNAHIKAKCFIGSIAGVNGTNGIIYNCNVDEFVIEYISISSGIISSMGGIVDRNKGIIQKSFVSGFEVVSNDSINLRNCGGIAYSNEGDISSCVVENSIFTRESGGICCINDGKIKKCLVNNSSFGFPDAGGIANDNNGLIMNCETKDNYFDCYRCGGITGFKNTGVVYGCTVKNSVMKGSFVGGISYTVSGSISESYVLDCEFVSAGESENDDMFLLGGIVADKKNSAVIDGVFVAGNTAFSSENDRETTFGAICASGSGATNAYYQSDIEFQSGIKRANGGTRKAKDDFISGLPFSSLDDFIFVYGEYPALLWEKGFPEKTYNIVFFEADSVDEESGLFNYKETSRIVCEYGVNVIAPESSLKIDGYNFNGWSNRDKLEFVTQDVYVFAQYERASEKTKVYFYTHKEGENKNTLLGFKEINVGSTLTQSEFLTPPEYQGYYFVRWNKSSIFVNNKNTNYSLIAEYKAKTHTVTFVDENATETLQIKYNQKIGRTPQPRGIYGGEFIGWSDGNMTYTDVTEYVVKQDVIFTAVYELENAKNFILYDELKGEAVFGIEVPSETLVPSSVNEIRSVYESYTLGTVTDGYKFIGWFDKNGEAYNFNNEIVERYSIAYAKYEVVKVAPLADAMQTISATQDLNAAIAQANAIGGIGRVEISLTTDAKITGMVDLTRANVTINGNGHTVTGISTSSASGGLRIKADGLMLKDITWDTSANKAWAMRVLGSFNVYFDGTVNVKAASGYAGIHVTQDLSNNDVTATFIGVSNDAVLNVTGGQSAAAIGSSNAKDSKSGKLVFRAGTFNLTGGANAAAIGGAARGSANDVIIRGNYVFEGSTEPIKLVVNANGGKYGAAIGTGYLYSEKNKTFGKLTVSDGAVVNAKAGQTGAAFGSGKRTYDPRGERATISGEETSVNFFSSTVAGFKDGIVELRGGTFFSLTQLNQGMMISGNEEKVLRINATNSTPKSQNIVAYTNKFMQNYKTEYLGRIRLALADSNGEEYGATDAQVTNAAKGRKTILMTTGTAFTMASGDNDISMAITLNDDMLNAGLKLEIKKNTIKITR